MLAVAKLLSRLHLQCLCQENQQQVMRGLSDTPVGREIQITPKDRKEREVEGGGEGGGHLGQSRQGGQRP